MAGRKRSDIPAPLVVGRNRFEVWRRTRKVGARIPDKLWALAVKLAGVHGVSRTASALKLDYNAVKRRVNSRNSDSASVSPAFVELPSPSLAASGECVVEFEHGSGASMRVHLRGGDTPDLVALSRSFWSGE